MAICLMIAPLAWAVAAPSDDEGLGGGEYQKKARFLFSFAEFVEWPAHKFTQPDSPLIIGIVGADPFGGLLEEAVQDRTIRNHTVTVRHVENVQELRKCHMIFVARSESARVKSILDEVRGDNVLTVTEMDRFANRGGIINFVMVNNDVRFQINDAAAKHAGLKVSSKLLSIAVPMTR